MDRDRRMQRVLVVDDDGCYREAVRFVLEYLGFHVETCCDGGVAAHLIASSPFDLVITDLEMPAMNGLQLIRGVRQSADTAGLPIILLTATPAGDARVSEAAALPRVSTHRKGGSAVELAALAQAMLAAA